MSYIQGMFEMMCRFHVASDIRDSFQGQGNEACDRGDECQEFGRPHIFLWSRVRSMVEGKGADRRFQIDGEVQENRHEMHHKYGSELVTLSAQLLNQFSQ
jgi:hypothetical protein